MLLIRNIVLLTITTILPVAMRSSLFAANRTAVTGDWETAGTWSPAGAPTCGDTLTIPAGVTVTVTTINDYFGTCVGPAMRINVYGTLKFQTGKRLALPCGSIVAVFSPSGDIQPGSGSGNSNEIEICGTQVWEAGDGTVPAGNCFPMPSCAVILPIQLLSFTAQVVENSSVLLSWTTATEINNDYFTVQRSVDGINFEIVDTVDGAGNSTAINNYSLLDEDPYNGVSYYRLKQTDFNNQYSYSSIIAVNLEFISIVSIYPNPASNDVTVLVSSPEETTVTLNITDVLGQTVLTKQQTLIAGVTAINLDVTSYSSGAFLFRVITEDHRKVQKQFLVK